MAWLAQIKGPVVTESEGFVRGLGVTGPEGMRGWILFKPKMSFDSTKDLFLQIKLVDFLS